MKEQKKLNNKKNITMLQGMIRGMIALLIFLFIYYVVDFTTSGKANYHQIGFKWENNTPYIPSMFIIYYSVIILPFIIPLYVRSKMEFNLLLKRIFISLAFASISYLLYPANLSYPKTPNINWSFVEKITPTLAGNHNLMPSLHVSISIIIIYSLWRYFSKSKKIMMMTFVILLIISTLLTHQHHFIDVVTGILLAFCIIYFVD